MPTTLLSILFIATVFITIGVSCYSWVDYSVEKWYLEIPDWQSTLLTWFGVLGIFIVEITGFWYLGVFLFM